MRGTQSLELAYPWLRRYFLHHAFSGRALPLLGSAFSHATFPHFLFNMMALWSFGTGLCRDLGPENFIAWYMSAAVLTSLGGMLIKLASVGTAPSLGASGAVLWMASTTAFRFPSTEFGIIFLPFVTLPAWQMIIGIASLDVAGLVLGWKMFDHGAHLAAVACGYLFVHGGYDGGVRLQRYVVREWRALRKSI
jgi:rhomboid-like protein